MKIYEKANHVEWDIIENQSVLIDTREMELFRLNEVGSAVWDTLDGQKKIEDILRELENQFDAPSKQIRKEVLGFIKKLSDRELIVEKNV